MQQTVVEMGQIGIASVVAGEGYSAVVVVVAVDLGDNTRVVITQVRGVVDNLAVSLKRGTRYCYCYQKIVAHHPTKILQSLLRKFIDN